MKYLLPPAEIPKEWYNILADLPKPLPPVIHPLTKKPVTPEDLSPIFPYSLIEQEVSTKRWIKIPEEILEIYSYWRPTPLYRAKRLEEYLDTPARIYYKYEGVSPPGSHKPNTAVAQAYFNKKEGVKRLTTETGAGQWGSALAYAGKMIGIEVRIYMVRVSYEQKPYRKLLMHVWGAEVYPSPSDLTEAGRKIKSQDPNSPGSLGIAISEAVEDAVKDKHTKYSLGSVLNYVLLHQTIIGLEAKKQMEMIGEYPDVIIACCGGGSNLGGISFPFLYDKFAGRELRVIAVESSACPTLTKGPYAYDFGDTAQLTPLIKMYTLGHDFIPPEIHAGGLRYHGDSPIISLLYHEKIIEARAYPQNPVFEAAVLFARTEGIVPAPETAHAIRAVIDEALEAKKLKEDRVILFNCSGHGYFDLSAYDKYFSGQLEDYEYPEEKVKEALKNLPQVE